MGFLVVVVSGVESCWLWARMLVVDTEKTNRSDRRARNEKFILLVILDFGDEETTVFKTKKTEHFGRVQKSL